METLLILIHPKLKQLKICLTSSRTLQGLLTLRMILLSAPLIWRHSPKITPPVAKTFLHIIRRLPNQTAHMVWLFALTIILQLQQMLFYNVVSHCSTMITLSSQNTTNGLETRIFFYTKHKDSPSLWSLTHFRSKKNSCRSLKIFMYKTFLRSNIITSHVLYKIKELDDGRKLYKGRKPRMATKTVHFLQNIFTSLPLI